MTQEQAIAFYRTANDEKYSCYALSSKLTSNTQLTQDEKLWIKKLDDVIAASNPTTKQEIFYRGANITFIEAIENKKPYPAYLSITSDISEALTFSGKEHPNSLLLKITIPSGKQYAEVSTATSLERSEKLLGRGCIFTISTWDINAESQEVQLIFSLHAPSPSRFHEITLI